MTLSSNVHLLLNCRTSKSQRRTTSHLERSRLTPAPQFPHPPRYRAQVDQDQVNADAAYRPRRTCMSVPASSERFLAKARDLAADEVMLDLEDSVAPDAKPAARELAVAALQAGGWDGKLVAVRVNDATTPWAYQDVIAVTEGAAGAVDSLILPKVSDPGAFVWLDVLLGQLERSAGLAPGGIGIEAQIDDAAGL